MNEYDGGAKLTPKRKALGGISLPLDDESDRIPDDEDESAFDHSGDHDDCD